MTGIKLSFAIASSILLVTNFYQLGTDALSHNIRRRNVQNDNDKIIESQGDTISNIQQESDSNDYQKSIDTNKVEEVTQNIEQITGTDTNTIKYEANNLNPSERDALTVIHQNNQNHRDTSQQDHYFKHTPKNVYEAAIVAANYNCTEEIHQEHTVITEKLPHQSGYPNNLNYLPPHGYNYPPPATLLAVDLLPPSIPTTDVPEDVTKTEIFIITTEDAAKVETIPVESSSGTEIPQITPAPIINNVLLLDITSNASIVADSKTNEAHKNESISHSETKNKDHLQLSENGDSSVTIQLPPKEEMEHHQGSYTETNDNMLQKDKQTNAGEVETPKIDISQSSNVDVTEQNCNKHNHNIEHRVHHYHHNIIHHQYNLPHIDYYPQHYRQDISYYPQHYRRDISYYPEILNPYEFFTGNYGFLNNNNNKNYVNIGKSNTKPCSICINFKADPPKNNKNVL